MLARTNGSLPYRPTVKQKNMVMSPAGLGTKNDCASEASTNLPDRPTVEGPISKHLKFLDRAKHGHGFRWDAKPRLILLEKTSSNLPNLPPGSWKSEVEVGGYQSRVLSCIVRRRYQAATT
jgi:hypothetical protein